MQFPPIKIGTRGSLLAMWQAEWVAQQLQANQLETEITPIETKGDKILDRSLAKIGSKGLFTEELEDMLKTGAIDIAVHSAKDVQATLPEALPLIAFSEREVVNDVLVSKQEGVQLNKKDAIVLGTSSVRRVAFFKYYYSNIKLVDMRGNLQTRLRKHEEGQCDALVLAYAGVHRMKYDQWIISKLPTNQFTPAVGQGSIAIQASSQMDEGLKDAIRNAINHIKTESCLLAERSFLRYLEGGCSIPAFGLATKQGNEVSLTGGVIHPEGSDLVKFELTDHFEKVEQLGEKLGKKVLESGGKEILDEVKLRK